MYRIPADLDLSPLVGEYATQIRVGRFDLQFAFGPVRFAVESPIRLFRDGEPIARWKAGRWPPPEFYEIMNVDVLRYEVPDDRRIVIELDNGIAIHLAGDSDDRECFQIFIEGNHPTWII